jgi:hypothetical protein
MKKLDINSEITYTDIEDGRLIESLNYHSYFFIGASICFDLMVEGKTYSGTLQTANTYYMNDYSLPSNSITLYDGDELTERMSEAYESDFDDDDFISELNDDFELDYTFQQWLQIYTEFNEIIRHAQSLIDEKECEADEAFECDDGHYVMIIEREEVEVEGGIFERRQCQESYTLRFNTAEEGDAEISKRERQGDTAYSVDKEQGLSRRHDDLSNF